MLINCLPRKKIMFGFKPPRWAIQRRTGVGYIEYSICVASGLVTAHLLKSVASPQIEVLDVGQGDSILLRSGEASMLVDGGGHPGNLHFGDRVLLPKLIDRGVTHLSVVVLSSSP